MSVYAVYSRVPFGTRWDLQDVFSSQEEANLHAASLVDDANERGNGKYRDSIVVVFDDRAAAEQQLPQDRMVPVTASFIRGSMEIDIGGRRGIFRR
jgi:hypothetical protein